MQTSSGPSAAQPAKKAKTAASGTNGKKAAKAMPDIPSASASTWRKDQKRTDVKQGRFSLKEKALIKESIEVRQSCP